MLVLCKTCHKLYKEDFHYNNYNKSPILVCCRFTHNHTFLYFFTQDQDVIDNWFEDSIKLSELIASQLVFIQIKVPGLMS